MDNFSEVLFNNIEKKITLEEVKNKISKYLVNSGSKKFVELYNDVAKNKNYKKAFATLNI